MKTKERLKGLLRNFSLSLCLVGVANPSKSVARDFYHRFTCDGHLFDHQS